MGLNGASDFVNRSPTHGKDQCISYRRIVLGFEGEKNMPKLNLSGNLPNTIRNNILKLPVIPTGAFSNIQDGVQDGRQNVNTAI